MKRALVLAAGLVGAASPATAEDDATRGARVFQKCFACHSVDPRESELPGPNLAGIVGKQAGTQAGFDYSEPFRARAAAGLVWNEASLDAYLADPEAFIPGTLMNFVGLRNAQERADVIAYLRLNAP